ncbi:MAG: PhaM family polyhydroxyalkanoate granule multifunctional regulatory protein [Rhodoferax sp.]|uniref:PhaM family polyhydroxyalkanoate granule multifunctional regulatory protein n=1 Tax=Rhodoferax sp. TaxID=50421 RepID=UPI003C70CFA0
MSDSDNGGFAKFVPGFDFLQNLAKGATQAVPQMPNLSSWIAPSLNEEELDKRIAELKAVHFWLDQNAKALGATVQALEVQKLTLATLKSMNLSMGEVANAFKFKTATTVQQPAGKVAEKTAEKVEEKPRTVADQPDEPASQPAPAAAAAGLVDPMQLWTALTQQFQHIAAGAMKEAGKLPAKNTPAADPKPASKKVAGKKAPAKTSSKVAAKSGARSR